MAKQMEKEWVEHVTSTEEVRNALVGNLGDLWLEEMLVDY
jgi:hypothetical protein